MMIPAFLATLLVAFQSEEPPRFSAGLSVGPVFAAFDQGLGVADDVVDGLEASLLWRMDLEDVRLTGRLFLREWSDVEFDRHGGNAVSLEGEIRQGGYALDLLVSPGPSWLWLGGTFGFGAVRFEHDLDAETVAFVELGPLARLEPMPGFFLEAAVLAHYAGTDFGEQHLGGDHLTWLGRAAVGFEVRF